MRSSSKRGLTSVSLGGSVAVRESQRSLLDLLREAEAEGRQLLEAEILETTGWKPATLASYLGKGQLSDFLVEVEDGVFEAGGTKGITPETFAKVLTQSKNIRGIGHKLDSRLARALLRRSRDNMVLALELYNRPSLENRLDGFALLYCTAWDQLLKARLIQDKGEAAIYSGKARPGRPLPTHAIRHLVAQYYKEDDPVRRNLEQVIFYRDEAAHLLMPDLQPLMARLFQAGIQNYTEAYEYLADQPFLPESALGLLSLVGDVRSPTVAVLKSNYGPEVGAQLADLATRLGDEIEERNDSRFAVPLPVRLVWAQEDEEGNLVRVARGGPGSDLRHAVVVEKPVSREKSHPHFESDAVAAINTLLKSRLSTEQLRERLGYPWDSNRTEVTNNDFRAFVFKKGWRNSNNSHHHKNTRPEYHYWSQRAVDEFVHAVCEDVAVLQRARESYANRSKSKAPEKRK